MSQPVTHSAAASPAHLPRGPLLLTTTFAAVAMSVILTDAFAGRRWQTDQTQCHLPVIVAFSERWPFPDLSDYRSATTPLYHFVLATAAQFFGQDARVLRGIGLLGTLAMLFGHARWLVGRAGPVRGLALALPLACSLYTFTSGAWLLPDNWGWALVVWVLFLALEDRFGATLVVRSALVMLALVLTRQIHIWAASVLVVAAWLGPDNPPEAEVCQSSIEVLRARVRRVALAMGAAVPSVAVLSAFFWVWGGLVPPNQRAAVGGLSPASPTLVAVLWGIVSTFLLAYLVPGAWAEARRHRRHALRVVAIGALAGLALGLLPETTYDTASGRFSGLWRLGGDPFPTVFGRSPLLGLLACVGGFAASLWFLVLDSRDRWVFVVTMFAFCVAMVCTGAAFQRYLEPMVLIAAGVFGARVAVPATTSRSIARAQVAGPVLLATLLLGVTVFSLLQVYAGNPAHTPRVGVAPA